MGSWNTPRHLIRVMSRRHLSRVKKLLTHRPRITDPHNQFENSGIYSLTCPDCQMKYDGQIGQSFHQRYKEHFHDYKFNIRKYSFATHLLDNNHSIGPINEIMEVLHTAKKERYMDTLEKFYIYAETRNNNQINGKNTVELVRNLVAHGDARRGEVKGKLANGVGSQYSHATSERGLSSIT